MTQFMYVFEGERLAGIQDVTTWPAEIITAARRAVLMIDRSAEISNIGRCVCCVCLADLGERPGIPAGKITHSYCPDCLTAAGNKVGIKL